MNMEARLLAVDGPNKLSTARGNRQVSNVVLQFMSNVT